MVITIEQGVLGLAAVPPVLSSRTWAGIVVVVARAAHAVGLEASLLEHHDEAALLGVLRRGAGLDGYHRRVRDYRGRASGGVDVNSWDCAGAYSSWRRDVGLVLCL